VTERGVRSLGPRVAALLCAVLVATGLTSCAGTPSYCSTLKSDQKQLKRLASESAKPGSTGSKALDGTVRLLSTLRDRAPSDISDDWETLVNALKGLDDAINASGAAPGDFGAGKKPKGITEGQYQSVQQAAAELQATPVQQSSTSIEQHALEVCKVDLGSGLAGTG
jgi:hypothetical protein